MPRRHLRLGPPFGLQRETILPQRESSLLLTRASYQPQLLPQVRNVRWVKQCAGTSEPRSSKYLYLVAINSRFHSLPPFSLVSGSLGINLVHIPTPHHSLYRQCQNVSHAACV